MGEELNSYVQSLLEDTQLMMDEYPVPEMAFTVTVLDKIEELLDCSDIVKEHCVLNKSDGSVVGEIHAYAESTNSEVLYLFYTDYNPKTTIETKNNTECQVAFKRLQGFYNAALRGAWIEGLDENSSEYRATKFIYDKVNTFQSVNLVVLSNYIFKNPSLKKISIATKSVYSDVWDLKKIYGNTHSLSDHVAIDIDFEDEEYSRYKIPFIQMESTQYGYKCIQAMFPAKLLYQLYDRYNTNLLYNNVRYFLGLKGGKDKKPNVAMLDTLRKSNEMFLAYNNGITALAKGIDSDLLSTKTDITDPESTNASQYISMGVLKKIMDFRIINGGQTTAVIYNARNLSKTSQDPEKKVNLLGVYVQVKLIISDEIEKISGNITLSSNFQNKIKYSDFSVSNEFNMQIEKLASSIIVPNKNNEPIYWFYERLRGQYDEKRKTYNTMADKNYFDFQFPKDRKFTKEEVAKVWTNWQQTPFDAVKGVGTTYAAFMKDINERSYIPDETYYKETIALIIIYRFLLARPENKGYGNGKATVAAYALSMLSFHTFGKFDLLKVWKNQCVSENTMSYLNQLSDRIYHLFSQRAIELGSTILSYGKTKGAFDYIKSQPMNVDRHLLDDDLI